MEKVLQLQHFKLRKSIQQDDGSGLVTQSCPTLAIPWTVAHKAPLSRGFSRQEYQTWLLFPSPEDLPNPGIKPRSPALQEDSLPTELPGKPWQIVDRYRYINTYIQIMLCMFLMHRLHLKEYQEMWPNGREEKHRKSLLPVNASQPKKYIQRSVVDKVGFIDPQ